MEVSAYIHAVDAAFHAGVMLGFFVGMATIYGGAVLLDIWRNRQ